MILIFTDKYNRKAQKFLKNHPELIKKYKKTVNLLEKNYNDTSLKLHKLHGKLNNFYAVSISYEYRIILILKVIAGEIILIDIGTHDEIY